jgi:phosphoribosylanthranilate isomerase
MRTRIKICGITRVEDGLAAARSGADAIGLVFWPGTPRVVAVGRAKEIALAMPAFVSIVGLFVDPAADEVRAVLDAVSLDLLQFHGHEPASLCRSFGRRYLKAVAVRDGVDLLESVSPYSDAAGLLFDSPPRDGRPGGTGRTFDWTRLPDRLPCPLVLSGGLDAGNVAGASARSTSSRRNTCGIAATPRSSRSSTTSSRTMSVARRRSTTRSAGRASSAVRRSG